MMKTIFEFFNVLFEHVQPVSSYDRITLEMIRFKAPESVGHRPIASIIPKDYLYYQVHEIEDDTWNYVASVHNKAVGDDIRD
jgi:hypothetical protein